jgi:hypothetical protein
MCEPRYLMDKVLDRWSAGKGDGPGGAADPNAFHPRPRTADPQ